jgi:hypothetical protein
MSQMAAKSAADDPDLAASLLRRAADLKQEADKLDESDSPKPDDFV